MQVEGCEVKAITAIDGRSNRSGRAGCTGMAKERIEEVTEGWNARRSAAVSREPSNRSGRFTTRRLVVGLSSVFSLWRSSSSSSSSSSIGRFPRQLTFQVSKSKLKAVSRVIYKPYVYPFSRAPSFNFSSLRSNST
ncbi:hypothetical protein WN51_07735 [Melipona quadrifasciata]|uniref:Uncharacterized protein n=1 Tax=Melipona quadrifasciata TaxID=166423 RepID=A0A0M9A902_9HYME|nr:hypothetical protein WN51_07735 [Melipona quadrifasciata]